MNAYKNMILKSYTLGEMEASFGHAHGWLTHTTKVFTYRHLSYS